MAILQWRCKDKEDYTWTGWFDSEEFVAFHHSLPELVAIEVRIKPDFVFVPGYYKYVGLGALPGHCGSLNYFEHIEDSGDTADLFERNYRRYEVTPVTG
jgi:hypothetical protein